MPENVISRCKFGGNLHHPTVAVGNHLVVAPSAGRRTIVNETHSVDFEEFQGCLVHCFTRATAVCKISDYRSVMGLWPSGPLKVYLISCSDNDVTLRILRILVADDIQRAKVC